MAQPNQNLQDILRTLSSFTTQPYSPAPGTNATPALPGVQTSNHNDDNDKYDPTAFDPNTINPLAVNQAAVLTQPAAVTNSYDPSQWHQTLSQIQAQGQAAARPPSANPSVLENRSKPPTPLAGPQSAPIANDPRNIITWSAAMSHIRPLLADEGFVERVRKLIKNQYLNERQWWEGRQALLKQQSERGNKRTELAGVLKAIGGKVNDGPAEKANPELEAAELARYDAKIYSALQKMIIGMMNDLATLGVPFFATKEALIREDDVAKTENGPTAATIKRSELKTLQKRILDFLEDLCQE